MFPFDLEEIEEEVAIEEDEKKDWEIDFETGKLTGRIITGLDAIKQWVQLALSTDRYYYPQYSWDFGHEFSDLIGNEYKEDYIQCEIQRILEDALLVNDDILEIKDIECNFENDKLTGRFRIATTYGEGEINV